MGDLFFFSILFARRRVQSKLWRCEADPHLLRRLMLTHFMSLIHDYRGATKEEKEKGGHELFITMNIYDLIRFSPAWKSFLHSPASIIKNISLVPFFVFVVQISR